MTDSEMLELAAKAYGNVFLKGALGMGYYFEGNDNTENTWNPLISDGDAFRLMMKLAIDIEHGDDDGPAVYAGYFIGIRKHYCIEHVKDDCCKSARRAITRAAAELGKHL